MVDPINQSIHFNLKTSLKTRFIKIRTIWDDRDLDNNNVSDYVTFSNESVQKMIRIWTLENERNENYDYDRNSNRKSISENGKNRSYTYYKNEKNGNTARVMFDGKWYYTYDDNGNRTARAAKAKNENNKVTPDKTGEYWEYTWDYYNRLVKVQQFNAPDNSQNVVVEYTYDAMNHRIERVSKTKSTEETTQYAYGRNGAMTYQKKTAGTSVTSRTFIYLNNQMVGFMDKTEDGIMTLRYAIIDIQGSVTEVYDDDSKLLWKSGYTAFGIKAGETTKLLDFDGLYTGCDYDAETGLTYHWNRWRSEDGEFWLSEDPARDGVNWYGYAGQNPVNYTDKNGLKKDKSGSNKSSKEKGHTNNNTTTDEDPHITGATSQEKQTPEYTEKEDNSVKKNIDNEVEYNITLLAAEYNGKKITLYFVVNGKKKTVNASLKKQAELQEKFGYDNILCYVTSVLNAYISDGVVSESFIDNKLGKIIKNNLNSKNELKFDDYSKDIARELGLKRYYDYVYTEDDNFTIPKGFNSIKEFREKSSELYTNTGKYAISRYRKVENSDGIDHYMLVRGNPWNDEVDPGRGIIKYKLVDVLPLRSCPLPGVRK